MKSFENDMKKILEAYKAGDIELKDAIAESCEAFEKEVENPSGKSIQERRAEFKERLRPFVDKYDVYTLEKFFTYWTGLKTPKSRLMIFEKTKTFNMSMRLATWVTNQKKFATQNAITRRETRLNNGRR